MIIFGWRALKKVLATGEFFCPKCGCDTPYRHLALRRWFTLFFLPVIPLDRLGTAVECTRCRTAFTEAVLGTPTMQIMEYQLGLANRAAMAHLFSLARPASDDDAEAALGVLRAAPGVRPDYGRAELDTDSRAFADLAVAVGYVRPLAQIMTVEGREAFVRRLILVVDALPHRTAEMDPAIDGVASALGLTHAHLAGIRQAAGRQAPTSGGDA